MVSSKGKHLYLFPWLWPEYDAIIVNCPPRNQGLPPLSPRPFLRASILRRYAPIGANAISLDEIDHFTGKSESQRRFAPMVIAQDEIVDRFQLKW
jgi:hypothetical protein